MLTNIQRYHIGPRLSEMVVHNHTVYLAGQIADDLNQDVAGQTRQVLAHVDRLLKEVGSDKQKILQITVYLADINEFDAMNEVWSSWVPQGHTPARTTVAVQLADPRYRVEVQLIAAL